LLANLDTFDTERVRAAYDLPDRYVLATLHRPANVDTPRIAAELVRRLHEIAELADLVIPLHPRGRSVLMAAGLDDHPRLRVLDPLGYIDFIAAVRGAAVIVTDSGGIQEETTILGVPCLTVRPNTERPITITHGTNRLVTLDEIVPAARKALANGAGIGSGSDSGGTGGVGGAHSRPTPPLWDGKAGPRIADVVKRYLGG
jgi:UDP-N-acetylglucosamine 2-epimerase (non-hydrolysing)